MTTKILIAAGPLLELLRQHAPEVEIELAKNATAQVAEALRKRIDKGTMVKDIVADIQRELSPRFSAYQLPSALVEAIEQRAFHIVNEKVVMAMDQLARTVVAEKATNYLDTWKRTIDRDIQTKVAIEVEKQVAAVLRAAAKLGSKGT